MATIEDLDFFSIVDASADEGIEHLRQIRLSRRTPVKKTKKKKVTSKSVAANARKYLDKNSINDILKMIGDD